MTPYRGIVLILDCSCVNFLLGKLPHTSLFFRRELHIPNHVSVLHVEQEVAGDDTLAVDSVLECDSVRTELMNEEKNLTNALNMG